MTRRCNILWLDDDLLPYEQGRTPERTRLQPWLRWFKSRQERFHLIEINSLANLAEALIKAEKAKPGAPGYLDAMLIDIMWREGTKLSGNFALFNFPAESILPMQGGAQLLGLMLNAQFAESRPNWLCCPIDRKLAVLTTLVSAAPITEEFLDEDAMGRVAVFTKEIQENPHTGLLEPDDKFSRWCESLFDKSGEAK